MTGRGALQLLLTNDDGITAPGMLALSHALAEAGHDVSVVAPASERSGAGASIGVITDKNGMSLTATAMTDLPDVTAWAIEGPPAMGILAACRGVMGTPPDLVVSGINPGWNSGRMVLHSGTVGAAMTAAAHDVPAIAVSVGPRPAARFDTGAAVAVSAVSSWVALEGRGVLNVNAPNVDLAALRGVRTGSVGRRSISDLDLSSAGAGLLSKRVERVGGFDEGSDAALIAEGFVSVTVLAPPGVDAVVQGDVAAVMWQTLRERRPREDASLV